MAKEFKDRDNALSDAIRMAQSVADIYVIHFMAPDTWLVEDYTTYCSKEYSNDDSDSSVRFILPHGQVTKLS